MREFSFEEQLAARVSYLRRLRGHIRLARENEAQLFDLRDELEKLGNKDASKSGSIERKIERLALHEIAVSGSSAAERRQAEDLMD